MTLYRQNVDFCFDARVKGGAPKARVDQLLAKLAPSFSALKNRTHPSKFVLALPARSDDLAEIHSVAAEFRRFARVIVAGQGGSSLSGRVMASLNPNPTPKLCFLETIDPDVIAEYLAEPADNTGFIVISKSGATAETMAQFYVLFENATRTLGKKAAGHFLIITGKGDSPLMRAAKDHGIRTLEFDADIGGRFSVMSKVGLLPAAIAGLDIAAMRQGAGAVLAAMDEAKSAGDVAPALGAALHVALFEQGRNINVLFTYGQKLYDFSRWCRQCWAESLGKNGKGATMACAMGTTDQHSQLQLYLDGPKDKFIHLFSLARKGTGQPIALPSDNGLAYLKGHTTGDIMEAEQKATFETLVKNGCPVRRFELQQLKEQELGALLMHFTLEILFTAALFEVNPLDQPAVEESKRLAREYLATGTL